jgi:hypothetical protein
LCRTFKSSGVETFRMVRILVLHDHRADEAAGLLARLLGPAMTAPLTAPPADWSDVLACVLVLAHAGLTAAGLERLARTVPAHLPVALWLLPSTGAEERLRAAGEAFGDRLVLAGTVPEDPIALADAAVALRRRLFREVSEMPGPELRALVMDGLAARTTCTLCTGHGDEVRATPIEYLVIDDRLYLLSEGGEKFAHLLANPRVSVAVYDPFVSMSSLFGLQLTGRAALVPAWSVEYGRALAAQGLAPERVRALPVLIHLVRIDLEEVEVVSSEAQRRGYAARQRLRL